MYIHARTPHARTHTHTNARARAHTHTHVNRGLQSSSSTWGNYMHLPYMYVLYALYVCRICMPPYMDACKQRAAEQQQHVGQLYAFALYVCLICMPYMYALYECLICMPYMYAYDLHVCQIPHSQKVCVWCRCVVKTPGFGV